MPSGRPTTPTALKILRGNPGKRKLNEREPKPSPGVPACPEHLGDEAKAEWNRITSQLEVLGLLTHVDRAAISAYCLAWGRWVAAEREITKSGEVLKSPESGNLYRSPWLDVANRAMAQMLETLREFGMTPSSRAKVHGSPQEKADPFAEFLKVKGGKKKA